MGFRIIWVPKECSPSMPILVLTVCDDLGHAEARFNIRVRSSCSPYPRIRKDSKDITNSGSGSINISHVWVPRRVDTEPFSLDKADREGLYYGTGSISTKRLCVSSV